MHRLVPAEALARFLIARWQNMTRSTLAAQQRRADISRDPQPLVRTGAAWALAQLGEGFAGPIHIHVAEQTREVDDCVAALREPPVTPAA